MSRYVDAEKLPSGDSWDALNDKEKAAVLSFLIKLPTIDVEEVRHGEWVFTDTYDMYHTPIYSCSACYHETPTHYIMAYNRCPHCGAKIDEKK